MKPHSLSTIRGRGKSPDQKFRELGPIAERHGRFAKGTVLPETRVLACPRVKVSEFPDGFIPPRFYERNLEQNQQIASCCRHPENHGIEGHKSHPDEPAPDIYIFHCQCGRQHRVFCVGAIDERPVWSAD